MKIHQIRTERLLLRSWIASDIEPFIAMGLDERVMKYFPKLVNEEWSRAFIAQKQSLLEERGWGIWAVEEITSCEFIGFVGFSAEEDDPNVQSLESPIVEIGWRLREKFWNKGYATEAALACLEFGFKQLHLKEIVSWTALINESSIRVMQKIGMIRNPDDDFDHPRVPDNIPLRRHLVYRIGAAEWKQQPLSPTQQ